MKAAAAILVLLALCAPAALAQAPAAAAAPVTLDFEYFRTKVEPILLRKRPEHARCYACHSQGTPLVIERMSPGATTWNDEQSHKNFDIIRRVVVPGNPMRSRLLLMPLAHEAGGIEFHPGGKHFLSQNDPEFKELVEWVNGAKAPPAGAAR